MAKPEGEQQSQGQVLEGRENAIVSGGSASARGRVPPVANR
jgi:hypothetical protein